MSGYDAYVGGGDDLTGSSVHPFDNDGYIVYDPRLPSQRIESFRVSSLDSFPDDTKDGEREEEDDEEEDGFQYIGTVHAVYESNSENNSDYELPERPKPVIAPPPPSPPVVGHGFDSNDRQPELVTDYFPPVANFSSVGEVKGLFSSDGPVLPPPEEMQEEGFALREWRRRNVIHLEEKEKREKEKLSQILDKAQSFKDEFYNKRKHHRETNKVNNREKEKVFLANQEKFHANADKQYWKAVAELIPRELPTIETKRGAKDKDKKKPIVIINQGPKPGKPTDLSRMRQILLKLKHNPPPHMNPPTLPPPPPAVANGSTRSSYTGAVATTSSLASSSQTIPVT
eukprot:Gb_14357 [translate_table: standard]